MIERGRYGVEWTRNPADPERKGLGWTVVVVLVLAIIAFAWTLIARHRARVEDRTTMAAVESAPKESAAQKPTAPELSVPPAEKMSEEKIALERRPQKVRNLLLKLEEARARRDVEMEVSAIEMLRALPGAPAADLDDALARRLGLLNFRLLFERHCGLWVKEVVVRSGQSASRIAAENGSTVASFAKLNGGNVDTVYVGKKMWVMNHPRFNLIIHRRSQTADLNLNGKFFKRYDILSPVRADEGAYELPSPVRPFWNTIGTEFRPADRGELELMMPKGSSVLISEL